MSENITEQPIPEDMLLNIVGAAGEAAADLGISLDDPPYEIVRAINEFVAKPPRKKWFAKVDNWDRALPLGSLWGQQLVQQLGWQWASVTFHDRGDSTAVGVFDPERRAAIYPFHFIFGCLENGATVTIMLSFDMLMLDKLPELEPRGYVNVMDHIHHIIPPD